MAKKPEKGGGDELDMLKASLLKKDLDVITITDKMRRLEDRSQFIVGSMEKISNGAREKIATLTDIIDFLTRYLANCCLNYSLLDELLDQRALFILIW